ncbi:hypothetical protein AB0758_49460 [Tolypothrix bouteillei VB521301_2]|uniref:SH3b domain-containing protein n=1 Tax=Tolypothrix bouteillei VB521301 TaxID=1479485 RepID=A0A0C1RPY1_9CYAN
MKTSLFGMTAFAYALSVLASPSVLAQHTFGNQRSHCQATLIGSERNTRITLRSGPGTNYSSRGYGLVGDRVYVLTATAPELDYEKDKQGYGWHRVGFPKSGATGWIREDLLRLKCAPLND